VDRVHPSAIVSPKAFVAKDVHIGAYSIIGDHVRLAEGCRIDEHVIIQGPTRIGKDCHFFPFGSIGLPPQDLKYQGEQTELLIGNGNVFREYVTVHRGTAQGGGRTVIGDHNFVMAYSHIAHDCILGNHIILANAATLAGHVAIHDHATVGAFSGVHQFCKVGVYGFVGGYSVITKDVLPYSKTVSAREAKNYGVNAIGLERRGFSAESIRTIKAAFRLLLQSKMNTTQALAALKEKFGKDSNVEPLIRFIEGSERGVIR